MYFSKITVVSDDLKEAMPLLKAGEYALHQWLWKLFPKDTEAKRDFLFRHDAEKRWPVFYLLSSREPDTDHPLLRVESKPYHPQLAAGETLSFSLRANPTHTRKTDDDNPKKRKRDDVVMHLKQIYQKDNPDDMPSEAELAQEAGEHWIIRQGARHGFEVLSVRADNYRQPRLGGKGKDIHFSTLDFAGILRVNKPEVFTQALCQGIGPAKAFGCGLLLVRRI
jgi:CRISPR system Cascade subunit CasE